MNTLLLEPLMKALLHGFSLFNTAAAALLLTLSGSLPESARPVAAHTGEDLPEALQESPILIRNIEYPAWFADSLLNLPEDLQKARASGKRGLMLYFSGEECGYCKLMVDHVFADPGIASYIQRHFDAIAIDSAGGWKARDFNGRRLSEQQLAQQMRATGTPTLVFIDSQTGQELDHAYGYQSIYSLSSQLAHIVNAPPQNLAQYRQQAQPCADFLGQLDVTAQLGYGLEQCQALGRPLLVLFSADGVTPPFDLQASGRDLEQVDQVILPLSSTGLVHSPDGSCHRVTQWAAWLGLSEQPAAVLFDTFGQASQIVTRSEMLQASLREVLDYSSIASEAEADQLVGMDR